MTSFSKAIDKLQAFFDHIKRFGPTEGSQETTAEVETLSEQTRLGTATISYLSDIAGESFKRQSELVESIWRSLPFFAATFAFVATVIGRSADDVPAWTGSIYSVATNGLLLAASLSMAWVLRWFWTVLRPRQYEYPAPDASVRQYAEEMTGFYGAQGLTDIALDDQVANEVRLFMVDQLGVGAATNLGHNAIKLKARSKVLMFMLLGFVFAFSCEAMIFLHDRIYIAPALQKGDSDANSITDTNEPGKERARYHQTDATEGAVGDRRRVLLGHEFQSKDRAEIVARKPTIVTPPTATGPRIVKPTPPPMQIMTKDRGIELGWTVRPPTQPTSKDKKSD